MSPLNPIASRGPFPREQKTSFGSPLLVSDMCVRTARCPRYVSRTSSTPLRPVAGLFLKMPETWPLDVLLL